MNNPTLGCAVAAPSLPALRCAARLQARRFNSTYDVTAQYLYYLTNDKSPLSYARHTNTKLDDLWERQTREADAETRRIRGGELSLSADTLVALVPRTGFASLDRPG